MTERTGETPRELFEERAAELYNEYDLFHSQASNFSPNSKLSREDRAELARKAELTYESWIDLIAERMLAVKRPEAEGVLEFCYGVLTAQTGVSTGSQINFLEGVLLKMVELHSQK